MTTQSKSNKSVVHKLGANRNEMAIKRKRKDKNFSQSKDIREDRSVRQRTSGHKK